MKTVIGNEAGRFRFLRDSAKLDENDKNSYYRLIKIGTAGQAVYDMTKEVAAASLKTLSQLLEKHYGQKVILRISS